MFLGTVLSSVSEAQLRYERRAFRHGEILTYNVKWGFIRLGTVTVKQEYAIPESPYYLQVWINGESAAGLPFIDVFFESFSILDVDHPTNILYELYHDRDEGRKTSYSYDPLHGTMFAVETRQGNIARGDTLSILTPYYDGPGLFMFTRCVSGSDTMVTLPTVMDFSLGSTTLAFSPEVTHIEVDAFRNEVPSYRFNGSTAWEGSSFGGMTGAFSGWVSTDSTRTVLRAEVEIFLGSVTIELESAEAF